MGIPSPTTNQVIAFKVILLAVFEISDPTAGVRIEAGGVIQDQIRKLLEELHATYNICNWLPRRGVPWCPSWDD